MEVDFMWSWQISKYIRGMFHLKSLVLKYELYNYHFFINQMLVSVSPLKISHWKFDQWEIKSVQQPFIINGKPCKWVTVLRCWKSVSLISPIENPLVRPPLSPSHPCRRSVVWQMSWANSQSQRASLYHSNSKSLDSPLSLNGESDVFIVP